MLPHYDDEDTEDKEKNEQQKDLFSLVTVSSRNKEIGTILIEQELKLMLLR